MSAEATARDDDPNLDFEARVSNSSVREGLGASDSFVGLNWRLLGDGFFDRDRWSRQLERRASLARLRARLDRRERAIRCRTERAIERVEQGRAEVLRAWSRFLNRVVPVARRAYLNGERLFDEAVGFEADQRRVRQQLASLPGSPEASDGAMLPPPFDIDFQALRQAMRDDPVRRKLLSVETALLRHEAELEAARETRLSSYVRYEMDNGAVGEGAPAVGLRFSMPLFSDASAGTVQRVSAEQRKARNNLTTRLDSLQQRRTAFQQQQSATTERHYRYLKARERLRRSLAAYRVGDAEADLGVAVDRASAVFEAANRRLIALRRLYREAGRAFELAGRLPESAMLEPVSLPDTGYRARTGHRALYVWSASWQRYGAEALVELARARGFDRLMVSASANAADGGDDLPRDLRDAAASAGIKLERLIGANLWALPSHHAEALERVATMPLPDGGLHLDVEPQALGQSPGTRDEHLAGYLDLLEGVRQRLATEVPLHVSVPVTWSDRTYRDVASWADRLYLMAYPSDDAQRVAERVRRVTDVVGTEDVVIAVRVDDFDSEAALDRVLRTLQNTTGIDRFALHDAGGLFELGGDDRR